ncbi:MULTISPECIES: serine hydrolase domain-containing protein [unclassified Pseudomonas]|uniref:serine hydrolase domain-containing protein n=1 Tax=unclassified Pseudomonas TaxID=196821 RepID=UPI0011EF7230|nr:MULTISPECIES: serine hydrolase domain-containing protein [unclassified Pseudomonas]KAA0943536.1 beta-lactamase family protein [Pseudomonas sp. ANT_H4]KAA0950014.1 beta-lactamase family protein [Pseudomonas sp. ANT_H14]
MQLRAKSLVALTASLCAAFACADSPDPVLTQRMDAVIDSAITDKRLVGTVVLVLRDGQLVYHRAAGLADREAGRPMTEETIFRLASVTKPLVSAAALRLVEQGKLRLDDPVTRWLPTFSPRLADGTVPVITVNQLLNHTAGLSYGFLENPRGPYRTAGVSDGLDEPQISLVENLTRIASVPLSYTPGTGWQYSMATDVLGAVLEKASGSSLQVLLKESVTDPLGLRDTGFAVTDLSRLSAAYQDGSPQPLRMVDQATITSGNSTALFDVRRILDPRAYPSGGAGMAGTAGDIARFLEVIRQGGAPILTSRSVQLMMADSVGPHAQTQGPGWGFGYGWAVLDDCALADTPQSKGTLQWGGAYGHSWFVDPQQKLTVVALTNTAYEGMSGLFTRQLRDAVYPPQ